MDKLTVSGEAFAPVLQEILSAGGSTCIVVSGSSMYPFLKHGRETVSLRAHNDGDLKRGQILLFQRPVFAEGGLSDSLGKLAENRAFMAVSRPFRVKSVIQAEGSGSSSRTRGLITVTARNKPESIFRSFPAVPLPARVVRIPAIMAAAHTERT